MLAILTVSISVSKDITVIVTNNNELSVTVFVGVISSNDNSNSDEELVQNRVALNIKSVGKALKPNKKATIIKNDLSGKQIIVAFGLIPGGGRTEVFRYRVKDIDEKLNVTLEQVKVIKVNNSYINIAESLKKTGNLGSLFPVGNTRVTGVFVFYNVKSEQFNDMLVAEPASGLEFIKTKPENNLVSDFLLKSATMPYMDAKGNMIRTLAAQPQVNVKEITLPGYEKVASIFGDKEFKYLTWKIVNNFSITAKSKLTGYLNLFNSCNETDKKAIISKFTTETIKKDSAEFHLYYIVSTQYTDTIEITESEISEVNETDILTENDLIAPKNTYRFTGTENVVYKNVQVISKVNAIDITFLLYYLFAKEGKFGNTEDAAVGCLDIYKLLGLFIELPALDEKALTITSPAYTISKFKEAIANQNILSAIEAKFTPDLEGDLPINVLQGAKTKIDLKK